MDIVLLFVSSNAINKKEIPNRLCYPLLCNMHYILHHYISVGDVTTRDTCHVLRHVWEHMSVRPVSGGNVRKTEPAE